MRVFHSIVLLLVLCLFAADAPAGLVKKVPAQPSAVNGLFGRVKKTRETSHYLADRVIVKLRPTAHSSKVAQTFGVPALDAFVTRYGTQSVARMFPERSAPAKDGEIDLTSFYVVRYGSPIDAFAVAAELSARPEVEYAEPKFIYETSGTTAFTPNDTSFALQWHLLKVRADSAWGISQGDTNVVVGIVDTGVQWDHPDLAANIWTNPGESGPDGFGGDKSTNGIDDDGDGKIDDYHGWDFGGADFNAPVGDNNPSPVRASHGHGTHCAGLASAVTNNVTGIAGIGFKCRILPVKASSDNDLRGAGGSPYITMGFEGLLYAAQMGANIISLSWGGPGFSQFEQDIINFVAGENVLIVAAAGNTGSAADPQYPASYDNVMSVAATQVNADLKATYSSYGEHVDVSAPGGDGFSASTQILSTYYPSTYAYITGTSMATPLTAGAAALVKSYFPALSMAQVGEQLRVTCDDIYGANSTYKYKLGKGRINAYKALTVASPSVRISNIVARDSAGGNNNGTFEPNEDIAVSMTFLNYLQPTSSATVTLSTANTFVTVTNGSYPLGTLGTMSSATNASAPFIVHVNPGIPSTSLVAFLVTITDGTYIDHFEFSLLFNPTYATHYINNVTFTVTNNGRIGYNDYPNNNQGVGFIFDGANQMFEGGLMVGYSATKLVDVVRVTAQDAQDADFSATQVYNMQTPGTISDQDGSTIFTDAAASATNKVGIQVNMHSYEYAHTPDSNYAIVRYDILNTSGAALNGVYAGLFFDWDMQNPGNQVDPYNFNHTSFDGSRGLGYAWYDTTALTAYCGARALDGAAGFRGLVNGGTLDLSRSAKFGWMSGGIVTDTTLGDVLFAISSGPYTIPAGATKMVAFALVGGVGLADLQANADAAQLKWNFIKTLLDVPAEAGGLPHTYALRQNYPNPFNPSTIISYDLPEASVVALKVVNVLGQEVATLVANEEQSAGTHHVRFDASRLASGVYLYQLRATSRSAGAAAVFSDAKKLLLVR